MSNASRLAGPIIESHTVNCGHNQPCFRTDAAFVPLERRVQSREYILKTHKLNDLDNAYDDALTIKTGRNSVWNRLYYPEDLPSDLSNPESPVLIGDTVYKTGSATGTTSGVVSNLCVDVRVDGVVMLCQTHVAPHGDIFADDGDSGAAVVGSISGTDSFTYFTYQYTRNARLLGLHWGSDSPSGYGWFTPIEAIIEEFGELDSI